MGTRALDLCRRSKVATAAASSRHRHDPRDAPATTSVTGESTEWLRPGVGGDDPHRAMAVARRPQRGYSCAFHAHPDDEIFHQLVV